MLVGGTVGLGVGVGVISGVELIGPAVKDGTTVTVGVGRGLLVGGAVGSFVGFGVGLGVGDPHRAAGKHAVAVGDVVGGGDVGAGVI